MLTFHGGLGVTDISPKGTGGGGGGGGGGNEQQSITAKFTTYGGVWYDFNPGPGDSGPHGLNLTPVNMPSYGNNGRPPQCVNMDTVNNQHFTHPHHIYLTMDTTNGITVGGWAYLNQMGGFRRILTKGTTTAPSNLEYALMAANISPFRWRFLVATPTTYIEVLSSSTLQLATWTFVVAQFVPPNTIRIRTNNGGWSTAGASGLNSNLASQMFYVGNSSQGGTHQWDGMLDGIFVVRTVLTDAEIDYIYNNGSGRNWI